MVPTPKTTPLEACQERSCGGRWTITGALVWLPVENLPLVPELVAGLALQPALQSACLKTGEARMDSAVKWSECGSR